MGTGWGARWGGWAGLLLCLCLFACSGEPGGKPGDQGSGGPQLPDTGAAFFARGGVLFARTETGVVALVTAFREGTARDTLPLAWPPGVRPEAGFMIGNRIAGLVPSPDSQAVVFWTSGVHSLLGAVRVATRGIRMLDFLLESTPVEASWAPVLHYVAVIVMNPKGDRELRVYEVGTGRRLALPWEQECRVSGPCSVAGVRWEGGSLLTVELRQGEDEVPVPYEVDVEELAQPGRDTLEEERAAGSDAGTAPHSSGVGR